MGLIGGRRPSSHESESESPYVTTEVQGERVSSSYRTTPDRVSKDADFALAQAQKSARVRARLAGSYMPPASTRAVWILRVEGTCYPYPEGLDDDERAEFESALEAQHRDHREYWS